MNGVHSTPTGTQRLLFADSKNRDVTLYPSGNSYVLHLTTPSVSTWSVRACRT